MDKHKLTVQLPQETMRQMTEMAEMVDTTKTEILRQTVAVQHRLRKEFQSGKQLLIRDPATGETIELLVM